MIYNLYGYLPNILILCCQFNNNNQSFQPTDDHFHLSSHIYEWISDITQSANFLLLTFDLTHNKFVQNSLYKYIGKSMKYINSV